MSSKNTVYNRWWSWSPFNTQFGIYEMQTLTLNKCKTITTKSYAALHRHVSTIQNSFSGDTIQFTIKCIMVLTPSPYYWTLRPGGNFHFLEWVGYTWRFYSLHTVSSCTPAHCKQLLINLIEYLLRMTDINSLPSSIYSLIFQFPGLFY